MKDMLKKHSFIGFHGLAWCLCTLPCGRHVRQGDQLPEGEWNLYLVKQNISDSWGASKSPSFIGAKWGDLGGLVAVICPHANPWNSSRQLPWLITTVLCCFAICNHLRRILSFSILGEDGRRKRKNGRDQWSMGQKAPQKEQAHLRKKPFLQPLFWFWQRNLICVKQSPQTRNA